MSALRCRNMCCGDRSRFADAPEDGNEPPKSFAAAAEAKRIARLATPLFAVGLLNYAVPALALMFVGHLGEMELAGAALASSFTAVTGFYVLSGMALGLETLSGQAYGADEKDMLGVLVQRATLVLSLMSLIISVIWANTTPILMGMHQDPEISKQAGQYARFMIPSIIAYGPLQCLGKFLQTQNNILPMAFSSGISLVFHAVISWILVFKTRLGPTGAALSISISYWINAFLLASYVKFSPSCKGTWTGFSFRALQKIPLYLRIAIPSALMNCFKVWAFEVMIILSGLLPNPKLETSVISICFNTFNLAWMIPYSLTAAVSTRVSNELGAGRPAAARLAAIVVLSMSLIEGVLKAAVMVSVRHVWGHVYSSKMEVIKGVASMMPLVALASSLDTLQSVLTGISTGCGWQNIGACVNLVSFNVVGIPAAVVLTFVLHLKAKGLMMGVSSAFVVQVLLLLFITLRTDWKKQASDAAKRLRDASTTTVADANLRV